MNVKMASSTLVKQNNDNNDNSCKCETFYCFEI